MLAKPTTLLLALMLCFGSTVSPQQATSRPTTNSAASAEQLLGVINRLKSYDLAQVAWGAHLAAEHGMRQLVPDLCRTLRALQARKRSDVYLAAMAILDTMIRLEAAVPPKDLKPWLSSFTLPAAMVLMAPKPKRYETPLLEVFRKFKKDDRNSRYWLGAGNLLVSIKSRKVAAQLLEGLHVAVAINVYDDDSNKNLRSDPGSWSGGAFDGPLIKVPKSYPPVPLYRFEKRKRTPESKLLAPGAKSIYYRRILSPRYRIAATYISEKPKRNLEWICALLDIQVRNQPFHLSATARHVWKDDAAYFRRVETEKIKVAGSFLSLIYRLQGKGLVTRQEIAGVNPAVKVYVFDHRERHLTPLPEIDGVQVEEVKRAADGKKEQGQTKKGEGEQRR